MRAMEAAPELPESVIPLNGGVHLALGEAPGLVSLRCLAERGVSVRSCGACLNFFSAGERLSVGKIGTLDEAAAALAQGSRAVAP